MNSFIKKIILSSTLMIVSSFAMANDFTCPTTNELSEFEGFYLEYPLSLNTQTREPNTWMVGQVRVQQRVDIVDSLFISPVQAVENEYPTDSAAKMIPAFQLLDGFPVIEKIDHKLFHLCVYWSPIDGSLASFVHIKDKDIAIQSPLATMNVAMKAISQQAKNLH